MIASNFSQSEWRKSSRSTSISNCVEVAWRRGGSQFNWAGEELTAVRDSKNSSGPVLAFPISSWEEFLRRS